MIQDNCVKYLVYVDILGFDELAEEIGTIESIKTRIVRDNIFREPLQLEIDNLKKTEKICGVSKGRDDWILIVSDFSDLFEIISKILSTELPVGKYAPYEVSSNDGNIPLEVAIGVYGFDKWSYRDGGEVICEDKVIRFLKTSIISEYRKTYRKENSFRIENWDLTDEGLKKEFGKRDIPLSECLLKEEGTNWKVIEGQDRYVIKRDKLNGNCFEVTKRITKSFVICTDFFFEELEKKRVEKYFVGLTYPYLAKNKEEKKYHLLNSENITLDGRIPDFLNKLGHKRSDYSGALIDRIFVPPDEYEEINE